MHELPLAERSAELTERSDAADNRRRILAAASELFAERDPECVSMQDVARAACVGMGTMYRRFGDRAGLTFALLGERHAAFQEQLLRGAPPLGPGAPARERLHAFGRGCLALLDEDARLLVAAPPHAASPSEGPNGAYRLHLALLLREAAPQVDAEYAVETLVAMFDPGMHLHLRRERAWSLERVQDGWCALVDAWIDGWRALVDTWVGAAR
jgi:AcrR family transcriptional regulator